MPKSYLKKSTESVRLPYFDHLLAALKEGNAAVEQSFGRHVHWGYWDNPDMATLTLRDFASATEALSSQVCKAGVVKNNQRLLDAGCGFGGTVSHINDNYQGMDLVGLNIDGRQLERAKQKVTAVGGNSIEFMQGDACALPFGDACFDVVLAVECIFHFPDRERFFKEAFRVLKPGGYLALSDFVSKPVMRPFLQFKSFDSLGSGFYGKCDLRYRPNDYRDLANKTQFKIMTERDITVNTLPTYRYIRRLSQEYPIKNPFAFIETAAAEIFSKLRLLDYYIYGLQKAF